MQDVFFSCCFERGNEKESCELMLGRLQDDWHGSKEDACQEAIQLFGGEGNPSAGVAGGSSSKTSNNDKDDDALMQVNGKGPKGTSSQVKGGKRTMGTSRSANPPGRDVAACQRFFVGQCGQSSVPPSLPAMKNKFMECCKTHHLDVVTSCEQMMDTIASRLDQENFHGSKDEACQQGIDLIATPSDSGGPVTDHMDKPTEDPAASEDPATPEANDDAAREAATQEANNDPANNNDAATQEANDPTADAMANEEPATDDQAQDEAQPSTPTAGNNMLEIGATGIIRRNQRR